MKTAAVLPLVEARGLIGGGGARRRRHSGKRGRNSRRRRQRCVVLVALRLGEHRIEALKLRRVQRVQRLVAIDRHRGARMASKTRRAAKCKL